VKKEEIEVIEDKTKLEQIVENFIDRSKSPVNRVNKKLSGIVLGESSTPKAVVKRRPSQIVESYKSRGSTPVADTKIRSKSPIFGFRE